MVYNKPPHPGYYLGDGMKDAPKPSIYLVGKGEAISGMKQQFRSRAPVGGRKMLRIDGVGLKCVFASGRDGKLFRGAGYVVEALQCYSGGDRGYCLRG